jgi:transposase
VKFVGIDWATERHFVALLTEDGRVLEEWSIAHDPQEVVEMLQRLALEGGPSGVLVGIESGAPLLVDQLLAAGYTVYALNPKQADRFRDRHSTAGAKDDRRDALVIADALRTDRARLRPLDLGSPQTEELRLRDRALARLIAERVRCGHQLRSLLERYYPAMLELERPMDDLFLASLLREYPEPEEGRRARLSTIRRLRKRHLIRVLDAERVRDVLRKPGFVVPHHVTAACRDEVRQVLAQLALLRDQIRESEQRLQQLFEEHPDRELLESLPGLGKRLAIRVIGELGGHRALVHEPNRVQAFAGTAPRTKSSGKRGVYSVSMRQACNRYLQSALFHMARCSIQTSRWAAAYVAYARSRGTPYGKVLRALSNKWIKILAAVLRTNTPYDDDAHLAILLRNHVPWVRDLATNQESAA